VLTSLALLLLACGADTGTDDTATDSATDTDDCEILEDVSCLADTGHGEVACPEGYTCSGPSAYWCTRGSCPGLPQCLPPGTQIATPAGAVRLDRLVAGDPVFSLSPDGRVIVVPVARVSHRPVPADHTLTTLLLSDGRVVRGSPAHPGITGQRLGDLVPGAALDGARVEVATRQHYEGLETWDLLPQSATGHYQADGVWLASTLAPDREPLAGR